MLKIPMLVLYMLVPSCFFLSGVSWKVRRASVRLLSSPNDVACEREHLDCKATNVWSGTISNVHSSQPRHSP